MIPRGINVFCQTHIHASGTYILVSNTEEKMKENTIKTKSDAKESVIPHEEFFRTRFQFEYSVYPPGWYMGGHVENI